MAVHLALDEGWRQSDRLDPVRQGIDPERVGSECSGEAERVQRETIKKLVCIGMTPQDDPGRQL